MWNRIHVLFGDYYTKLLGLPGGSDRKEFACSAGCWGLILGSGRSPAEGNGNPLQYSCLENSVDRGAWCCKESDMTERLTHTHTHTKLPDSKEKAKLCVFSLKPTFPSKNGVQLEREEKARPREYVPKDGLEER